MYDDTSTDVSLCMNVCRYVYEFMGVGGYLGR